MSSRNRPAVRLLHTSDVHLSSAGGWSIGDHLAQCLCSLDGLRRVAHDQEVDLFLIAGDLFDHARQSEDFVERVFSELESFPAETVLLVGNHDVHDDNSLYDRYAHVTNDTSVHVLLDHAGEIIDVLDGAVRVWGKAMDEHRPEYEPLAGVPGRPDDRWFVAMGHGLHTVDPADAGGRSSLIQPPDIAATQADYVALGHHHHLLDVSTPDVVACYSGSPSEFGSGRTLVVDLDPQSGTTVRSVSVNPDPAGCAVLV